MAKLMAMAWMAKLMAMALIAIVGDGEIDGFDGEIDGEIDGNGFDGD